MCKLMLLLLMFCATLLADEVAEFAAFPDPDIEEREALVRESIKKWEEELKSEENKRYFKNVTDKWDANPNSSWKERLRGFIPYESEYSRFNYYVLKEYQKKHSIPDKDIREGLLAIVLDTTGNRKYGPYPNFIWCYTDFLKYYGDDTTLPILEKIMDAKGESSYEACEVYTALSHGELNGKLLQFFGEDDPHSKSMRDRIICTVELCCSDRKRSAEERKRFRKALLQLYYLNGCDTSLGRELLRLRCYDSELLRSLKWHLIAKVKLYNDDFDIRILKEPRWQKIDLGAKTEKHFQEILKREIPPQIKTEQHGQRDNKD